MTWTFQKLPALIGGAFIAIACIYIFSPHLRAEVPGDKPATASASLDKLRGERVAVLTRASEISAKEYASGMISFSEMNNCMKSLMEAKLEAAKTPKERAEILAAAVAAAQHAEQLADTRFKAGLATELERLEAKSDLLRIQIADAKEQPQ